MKITIECECGNIFNISVLPKKYLQLRDVLESQKFCCVVKNEKEICIFCKKCKNWMDINFN